jgi:PAS domain S-box-containing protein
VSHGPQRHRVLLVDDDPALLAGLARVLHREHYEIICAGSGPEALARLEAQPVDVIVSDHDMPGMLGIEFLAIARDRCPDTARFILTGKATLEMAVAAINVGAVQRFFVKPCDVHELAASIRAALQMNSMGAAIRRATGPVVLVEPGSGAIVQCNRPAAALFDRPAEALVGSTMFEHLAEPDRAVYREVLERLATGDGEILRELSLRRRDGALLTVEASSVPAPSASSLVCTVLRDIGERKTLEQQLLQLQRVQTLGSLAGGVAHDFNNLLTIILGRHTLMLNRLRPDDPIHREMELIKATAQRGATLTRQLLGYGRPQPAAPRSVNLNGVVTGMGKMIRRLIGEHIELVTLLEPELGRATADPGQLEQVLLNLAVNGRDAMPDGGRLTLWTANVEVGEADRQHLGLARPGAYVLLSVADTGIGMDAETRARIFEPFFTTKTPDKGTGLGLATVARIVEDAGGGIRVQSSPGAGAVFDVYLPRAPEAGDLEEACTIAGRPPRGSETILLVEDDDEVRRVTREALELAGYTVLEARRGGEALEICRLHAGPIDVLLTDIVMPEMSGPEAAAAATSLRPGMKVIYMSGYTDDGLAEHGAAKTTGVFLRKPFLFDTLAHLVRATLDGPEPVPTS